MVSSRILAKPIRARYPLSNRSIIRLRKWGAEPIARRQSAEWLPKFNRQKLPFVPEFLWSLLREKRNGHSLACSQEKTRELCSSRKSGNCRDANDGLLSFIIPGAHCLWMRE